MGDPSSSKTAFVFAGGGSLGTVEVGMLQVLVDRGIRADFVVGASVGAVNGAYFAGRPDAEGVRELTRIWGGSAEGTSFPSRWLAVSWASFRSGTIWSIPLAFAT